MAEGGLTMAAASNAPLEDKDYDLISVVYHASQRSDTCRQYASDAKKAGDQDAADFFDEVRGQYAQLSEKGKALLKHRL
jgi:dienelactone hydrolase